MSRKNKYAPILHTGFHETYNDGIVEDYIKYCVEHGYSGVSLEGKSKVPTNNIDEWAEAYKANVKKAITAANENGIDIWLFDEWGYPTGTAAGKTISGNPDFRSKTIRKQFDIVLEKGEKLEFTVNDRFLSASAWKTGRFGAAHPIDGHTEEIKPENNRLYYKAEETTRIISACWDYCSSATHGIFENNPNKTEYGTIDLLNPDAVKCFIKHMHEGYYKEFGELFGNGLAGFFYDEPFLSYPFPYTKDIFDVFREKKGYDIVPKLPIMLAEGWYSDEIEKCILDYREIVTDKMAEAFVKQLRTWCNAHNVIQTGHQDLDHNIRGLNTISGDFFKNSECSDSPGIDYIWNQINRQSFCDYPRFAGSVKHLCGKSHASSESFAVTGVSMPPDGMRWAMEHQIIRGIDLFYLMYSEPDMANQTEYTKVSRNNPQNIRFGKMLNSRIAEVNRLAYESTAAANIAIYVPMDEAYVQSLRVAHPWMTSTMPHIWDKTDKIAEAVCYSQHDYEYIWDNAIVSMPIKNGAFTAPSGQRIDTVIMPGNIKIPEKTTKKLLDFLGNGGKIIITEAVIPSLHEKTSTTRKSGFAYLIKDANSLKSVLGKDLFQSDNAKISLSKRKTDKGNLYFLLNESDDYAQLNIGGKLYEYSFERKNFDISVNTETINFAPGELRILSDYGTDAYPSFESMTKNITVSNWVMHLPDGTQTEIGSCIPDWREYIAPDYSGGIKFTSELTLENDSEIYLDFGRICYSAIIQIDGEEYKLPFSPYRLHTKVSAGIHCIEMTIFNTSANSLLGTYEKEKENSSRIPRGRCEHDRFRLESGFADAVICYYKD